MSPLVRTVLGDVEADQLGSTDYHEHLFHVSPLLPDDELDDEELSGQEAQRLHEAGIMSMVDATPTGLGRNPTGLARISTATGLTIIAATGGHREEHYGSGHWLLRQSSEQLADRFTADIQAGMPATDTEHPTPPVTADGRPVQAGLVKAGVGYWSISDFERRALAAAAQVHGRTGAPVMVHLEHGSCAYEVLDLLQEHGVDADAVALAHMDRNLDAGLHADLAARGAYLGYDGAARHRSWPDSLVLACLVDTASRGASTRILLGGDVARRTRYVAYGGLPGLDYLPRRFLPRLRALAGPELVTAVTEANPQRFLGRFRSADPPVARR